MGACKCECECEKRECDLGKCVEDIAALRVANAVLKQQVQDAEKLMQFYRSIVEAMALEEGEWTL